MKKYILLLLATFCSMSISAQTVPSWQWAKTIGWNVSDNNGRGDTGNGVATDAAGNVYVTGKFLGAVDFGDGNLISSQGAGDMYLASYDCSGNLRWAVKGGGPNVDQGLDVKVGKYGDVYIAGAYQLSQGLGIIQFGDTSFTGRGDFFFAKYDTAGNFHWFRNTNLPPNIYSGGQSRAAINFDGVGNVYVVSENSSDAFPGHNFNGLGFLAKYDTSGNLLRVTEVTKPITGNGFVTSIAVDSIGNAYVGGYFTDSVIVGGVQLVDDAAGFLVKIDTAGNTRWVRKSYSPWGTGLADLTLSESADIIFITQGFKDTLSWSGSTVVAPGSFRPFIFKLDTAGNAIDSDAPQGNTASHGATAIALKGHRLALGGTVRGNVNWQGMTATQQAGISDPFLYFFDTSLVIQSMYVIPAVGEAEDVNGLAFDEHDNVYMVGTVKGNVYLPTDTAYFKGGNTDGLLAKFGSNAGCVTTSIDNELIAQSKDLRLQAWPNPTDGQITIAHEMSQSSGTLILHDMQGRKLLEREIRPNASQTELDLSGRAAGLYLISVVTDEDRSSVKVVVQ